MGGGGVEGECLVEVLHEGGDRIDPGSAIFADWGIMGEGKSGVRRVPGGFV